MNSSSAFSNVLSVSPVQPPSQSASTRSLNDNSDSPGFKRALADVRSERDIQPKEPCATKLAAADRPAKTKAAPEDTAAVADKNTASSPKKTGKTDAKAEREETDSAADQSKKVENPDPLLAVPALAVAAPVDASAALALAGLDSAAEGEVASIDTSLLPAQAASLSADANTVLVDPDVARESVLLDVPAPAIANVSEPIKAIDPTLVTAVNPAAVAEALVAAGLTPVKNAEVKLDKLVTATDASGAAADEALLASDEPPATADPKAVFEKMLQAIANGGANGSASGDSQKAPDLAATIAALTSPTTSDSSAAIAGLESLSRGAQVQLPAARNFVVQTAVPVNVGQPTWSQAVGEKVLWLAAQNVQSAEIILDPPEVGPMQVKVSVHQEQTSISFTSHNAGVRELLDQSLGRLRDMFNEQGLNLVNVDVSDKSFQRQQGDGGEQQGQGTRAEPEEEESLQAVSAIVHQRLVDHYA